MNDHAYWQSGPESKMLNDEGAQVDEAPAEQGQLQDNPESRNAIDHEDFILTESTEHSPNNKAQSENALSTDPQDNSTPGTTIQPGNPIAVVETELPLNEALSGYYPTVDPNEKTRKLCFLSLFLGIIIAATSIITGIVLYFLPSPDFLHPLPQQILPVGTEILALAVNFAVTGITDGLSYIHSISLFDGR